MVSPTTMLWNHSPKRGPKSIASSWASISGMAVDRSMLVEPLIIPPLWLTTFWAISKIAMTISHVLVTKKTATKVLNIHLKKIYVSTSCRLFFSITSWMSS